MFKTVKPIKEYWSKKIPFFNYGRPNPLHVFSSDQDKFSAAMETFKFKQVYKHTGANRHVETQTYISGWLSKNKRLPVILDIGASDGSTSLSLMHMINGAFEKYYVTDYNISCSYYSSDKYTYFFNNDSECFLVASNKFVFYPNSKLLFDFLFRKKISKIKNDSKKELLLINLDLQKKSQADGRVKIIQHNIFEQWPFEKADVVIVGNLLHRFYFSDEEIIKALGRCYDAMTEDAILVVIRNIPSDGGGEIEETGIYRKNAVAKKFEKVHAINGGIEFNELLLSLTFAQVSE